MAQNQIMAGAQLPKEDSVGQIYDRCFADAAIKLGAGVIVGSVFSLLFFKRRSWPIILGGGFSLGVAYNNCERELNDVLRTDKECQPKQRGGGGAAAAAAAAAGAHKARQLQE
ncbi:MICOS complex subunit Mic10 [Anabrus simplex]|uniref:MICOS complex subunit Mic10 n=1 Tax=Anabrus simplex TaxID=316456 RepID=UPI0035A26193